MNIQLNANGNYQNSLSTNNTNLTALPVGSSSSASSSAIASFITAQNQNNQKREACVLVCTSIEHSKAHCPPTLGKIIFRRKTNLMTFSFSNFVVRAVTLASRYLIQSFGKN